MTSHLELRKLSKAVFGREHQIEVAQALERLTDATTDEVVEEARRAARDADADPPGESAIRICLARLTHANAVTRLGGGKPGNTQVWVPNKKSDFWPWLSEMIGTYAEPQ